MSLAWDRVTVRDNPIALPRTRQALVITLLGNDQFFSVVGRARTRLLVIGSSQRDLSTGTHPGSICSGLFDCKLIGEGNSGEWAQTNRLDG